jgi:hypothetical protein
MFFLSLLDREDAAAKASELRQFLLDLLQPLKSLAVRDLSLLVVVAVAPVLLAQFFDLCDLVAEAGDLFAKNFDMIHGFKNNPSATDIIMRSDKIAESA